MRYVLDISYKGTNYHGWQLQANAHSVQAELNQALSTILKEAISTLGSGRTDTGVHAEQQIVQFDFNETIDFVQLKYKLNRILPLDICVNQVKRSVVNFSARFDAISRAYEYRIIKKKDPFANGLAFYYHLPLDINLMNKAASILYNYKDFECFSKNRTNVEHFLCDIYNAEWQEEGNWLIFKIKANRFLRGMVRAIVGTLIYVGLDKLSLQDFEEIIKSKDRKRAGMSAPAQGLFLVTVEYPKGLLID